MKTLIIGTLDFLGHIYAVAMILGGAAYGFSMFGVPGLLAGLLGGVFASSITVGLLFLLLDIRDSLRRMVAMMEADRFGASRSDAPQTLDPAGRPPEG